jgi:carbon storage regulator
MNHSSEQWSIQPLHYFADAQQSKTRYRDILASTGDRTMLVRSRRVGESVRIAPDITLTIVQVRGDQVRFRVTAPPDVGVYREEIVNELNQAAINALSLTIAGV